MGARWGDGDGGGCVRIFATGVKQLDQRRHGEELLESAWGGSFGIGGQHAAASERAVPDHTGSQHTSAR